MIISFYRRRRRRRGSRSEDKISDVTAKETVCQQPTNLSDGDAAPTDDPLNVGGSASDHGGPSRVSSVSSRVPVINVDRWAVRPQPWLHANTTAKPGRYSDVIGPFD